MGVLLSTNDVQVQDRFSYWCDLICDVFVHLDASPVEDRPFFGTIDTHTLSYVQFSDVRSCGQHVVRSKRQISKTTEDYYLVSFQIAGRGEISQDGRTAYLQAGQYALYDSTRPYTLNFTDKFEQLVVQLPREQLRRQVTTPENITATAISGQAGLGKVTYDFVQSMYGELNKVDARLTDHLAHTTTNLLATSLSEAVLDLPQRPHHHTVKIMEIKAFIQQHLAESNLSIERIAKTFSLSPRYLHTLFQQEETTLAQFIRDSRLEQCRRALSDPTQAHRTITDIAFSWGFNNTAHFSQRFKKRYGISPRRYRVERNG